MRKYDLTEIAKRVVWHLQGRRVTVRQPVDHAFEIEVDIPADEGHHRFLVRCDDQLGFRVQQSLSANHHAVGTQALLDLLDRLLKESRP